MRSISIAKFIQAVRIKLVNAEETWVVNCFLTGLKPESSNDATRALFPLVQDFLRLRASGDPTTRLAWGATTH